MYKAARLTGKITAYSAYYNGLSVIKKIVSQKNSEKKYNKPLHHFRSAYVYYIYIRILCTHMYTPPRRRRHRVVCFVV